MKLILAYIQPHRLEKVALALRHLPQFPGMTIVEARGLQPAEAEAAVGGGVSDFKSVLRLESVVPESLVNTVIDRLMEAAHTGLRGDGRVFVLDVEAAMQIRTLTREAHP